MTENTDIQDKAPVAADTAAAGAPRSNWHTWMAAFSAVLALAAWIVLCVDGYVALGIGVCAFVAACLGLHAHTRSWRNLATTALVASGVILVVLAAFVVVMIWGQNAV